MATISVSALFIPAKNKFLTEGWAGSLESTGVTMNATLVNVDTAGTAAWVPDDTDDTFADVTPTGGTLLTNGSTTIPGGNRTVVTGAGALDFTANTTYTSAAATTGNDTADAVLLSTGVTLGTSNLLALLWLSSSVVANGGDIILTWDGAPNYVFRL